MAKLTKKQYSRKRLTTAVIIFVAVVLIVTGIAIWLLFNALAGTLGANITVGGVIDSPLDFARLSLDGIEVDLDGADHYVDTGFRFDSAENDFDGRLMWDGVNHEKMITEVDVVINHAQYLQKFEYTLQFPSGVIEAAKKGYLDISEYYDLEKDEAKIVEVPLTDGTFYREQDAWRLKFTLELKWGRAFGGVNPSIFYDEAGADISYDDMRGTLNDFYDMIMSSALFSKPTFNLTVIASPKV